MFNRTSRTFTQKSGLLIAHPRFCANIPVFDSMAAMFAQKFQLPAAPIHCGRKHPDVGSHIANVYAEVQTSDRTSGFSAQTFRCLTACPGCLRRSSYFRQHRSIVDANIRMFDCTLPMFAQKSGCLIAHRQCCAEVPISASTSKDLNRRFRTLNSLPSFRSIGINSISRRSGDLKVCS
jgi:hypothetical protein